MAGTLKDVIGFAGCLVMISGQEARLATVVTFWMEMTACNGAAKSSDSAGNNCRR